MGATGISLDDLDAFLVLFFFPVAAGTTVAATGAVAAVGVGAGTGVDAAALAGFRLTICSVGVL